MLRIMRGHTGGDNFTRMYATNAQPLLAAKGGITSRSRHRNTTLHFHSRKPWARCSRHAIALALGCVLASNVAFATDDPEAALRELRERIATIGAELEASRETRDDLRQQLDESERRLAELDAARRQNTRQLRDVENDIDRLESARAQMRGELRAQHESLANLVRLAYRGGEEREYLRLLLSQDDPARIGRILAYYRYIADARREVADSLARSLQELAGVQQDLDARRHELDALQNRLQADAEMHEGERRRRGQLLAAVESDIAAQGGELVRLREDEARLGELIERIEREAAAAAAAVVPPEIPPEPFAGRMGQLAPPVQAPITAGFGQPRAGGGPASEGVFFAADAGAAVQAVHDGRVLYADWLRGFGLLLILDHGDGYMSLYSHNQQLEKSVGDWVAAGEPIGRVGDTGGLPRPGLYFEIRHQGRPTDPMRWIRRG
jgi:murein hydrolase activator